MPSDLSQFLACPDCRTGLKSSADNGSYQCGACDRNFPVNGGIPRFVKEEGYAASFGYEWNVHKRTQLDGVQGNPSEQTFREKTGLEPRDVQGKSVLDAGCGMGRFADVVSRWGAARVVAVDLSTAVNAAFANLAARDNASVVQADIRGLPFRDGVFDIIYSIGVLHHTPDCESALRSLPRFLKPGGRLVVWLYDKNITWGLVPQLYWRYTRNMNPRRLHALCRLAIPLYYLVTLPVVGKYLWRIFPIDTNPDPEWRVLDTFDWYSAKYRSWHTYEQVRKWLESEGLTEIKHLPVPVSLSAKMPG